MIRRSHKKSRRGCAQCKRAHKKCDEAHPTCSNCRTAEKLCSFSQGSVGSSPSDFEFVGGEKDGRKDERGRVGVGGTKDGRDVGEKVNMLHLELFRNLTRGNLGSLSGNEKEGSENFNAWLDTVLKYDFSYPYLMYETLAISAFHLSTIHPEKASLYLRESASLQAQALALFNTSISVDNPDNIIPSFLFSSVLRLHFFCETFSSPRTDLNDFLDRLVQSINLLRGVLTLIGDQWETIKNSDIRCLLAIEDDDVVDRNDHVTHAFESLLSRLSSSPTLTPDELAICTEAVTQLVWVYNSQPAIMDGKRPDARMVVTWPIKVSAEFTRLLDERKPEALVVLAYFSIVLDERRSFWAVGEAGKELLRAIGEFLGVGWREWLRVPRGMVLGEDGEGEDTEMVSA